MNIREKTIINNLRSKNGDIVNRQLQQLFYTDINCSDDIRAIRGAIQKTIRYFFSDRVYAGRFREIYDTVLEMLLKDIQKASTTVFDNVQNLKNYLKGMTHNICVNPRKRKEIHICLGINTEDDPLIPSNDREDDAETVGEKEGLFTEEPADVILERYISLIPNKSYRDILYELDIKEVKNIDYAAKHGMTVNAVNVCHRHAKIELTRAALAAIRKESKLIFEKNKQILSKSDAELLDSFFSGKPNSKDKKVAEALQRLMIKYNREIRNRHKARIESSKALRQSEK